VEVHTTERTRHFLVKKPKKILQLRLEDKNVFNAIHLNSIGYVFEFGTTGWTVRKFASTKYLQYNIAKDKYLANANLRKAISLSKTTGSTATRWKAMVAAERALLEDQGVTPLYYTNEATLVRSRLTLQLQGSLHQVV